MHLTLILFTSCNQYIIMRVDEVDEIRTVVQYSLLELLYVTVYLMNETALPVAGLPKVPLPLPKICIITR